MMTRDLKLLFIACLVITGFVETSWSQERLNPRNISRLKDSFPGASQKLKYNVSRQSSNRVTPLISVSDKGLLLVSQDGQSIQCIADNNQVIWESMASADSHIQGVTTSVDGRYVYLYHYKSEVTGVSEVLTSDGQSLWQKPEVGYHFSLSGQYMFSRPSLLKHVPVRVLDTRSGEPLWTHEVGALHAISDLGTEKLLYIADDHVYITELSTGRQIRTQPLSDIFPGDLNYALWELTVSEDGSVFVITERNGLTRTSQTTAFDGNGNMQWTRNSDGSDQLIGLTPNCKFLILKNGAGMHLLDAGTGNEIWTVEGRILNNGAILTNRAILIHQAYDTLIFRINPNGRLIKQERINRSLLFSGNRARPYGLHRISTRGASVELLLVDIQENNLSFSIESMGR